MNLLGKPLGFILRGNPFMGGFLRMLKGRPKDLGDSHADQIFVFRGSPECFAVRLPQEIHPSAASAPVKTTHIQVTLASLCILKYTKSA